MTESNSMVVAFVFIVLVVGAADSQEIFSDGFEIGSTCSWSSTEPSKYCRGVFFLGDFDTNNWYQAARVDFPGGIRWDYPFSGLEPGEIINSLAAHGTYLAASGVDDASESVVLQLYNRDGSGVPVTLVDASNFTNTDASFLDLAFSPNGEWIAFRSDLDFPGETVLWAVSTSGSDIAKPLSFRYGDPGRDVSSFKWVGSGQGYSLAFVGDFDTPGTNQLWIVDPEPAVPLPILLSSLVADVENDIGVDVHNRVYYIGDEGDGFDRLFRVDLDGQNLELVPGTDLPNDESVGAFAISSDGANLAFSADSTTSGLYQVYVLDLTLGLPTAELVSAITTVLDGVTNGPTSPGSLVWSPDGSRLVAVADWTAGVGSWDNTNSAFLLPTSGPPGGFRLMGPPPDLSMDVNQVVFSRDSQRLFVRGDLRVNNDIEVYSTGDFISVEQDPSGALLQGVAVSGDIYEIGMP